MMASRTLFILLAVGLGLAAGEILTGYLLWRTEMERNALSVVVQEFRDHFFPNLAPEDAPEWQTTYLPHSPFQPDPDLGFSLRPGSYTIRIDQPHTGRAHQFQANLDPYGRRLTSPSPNAFHGRPEVWIFGDSFIFGWGNNEPTTLPWFLQRYLPDRRVVSFANPGYGNLHAWIQLKKALPLAHPAPDSIIIAYADYYNERNCADAQRISAIRAQPEGQPNPAWEQTTLSLFTHPRARLVDGRLLIDHIPLFPPPSTRPDPQLVGVPMEKQWAITRRLLDQLFALGQAHSCRMFLAYLQGPDTDPVVAHARQLGFHVADLRPRLKLAEWDDFRPFDPHPGPRAQSVYADKLFRALSSAPNTNTHPTATAVP